MTTPTAHRPYFLGIEGGGTRTVALLADAQSKLLKRFEFGPCNLKLISDLDLQRHFRTIARSFPRPDALSIGLAGLRTTEDRSRVQRVLDSLWPKVPIVLGADLQTALAAASPWPNPGPAARVLILSGTGSCCYGTDAHGRTAKIGGWGHLLGDKGSGYEIGLRGLKAIVYYYDRDGTWPALGARILRALNLNNPDQLIPWTQAADKTSVARLAIEVFEACKARDKIASDILKGAAHTLASDANACARRLASPADQVEFIFAGSVLLKQPRFAAKIADELKERWPNALMTSLPQESVWGAVRLAQGLWQRKGQLSGSGANHFDDSAALTWVPNSRALSPTERRNPRSARLDKMPLPAAVALMLREDAGVSRVLLRQKTVIAKAVAFIQHALRANGRLFYVGAGTSGRLGVLDASECPPTFRTAPEQVQGIIAGGQPALWRSIEGAEDDAMAGAAAIQYRAVRRRDVVVGIAASGRTPFVWGALNQAKGLGAKTILLTFNPYLDIPARRKPTLVLAFDLGPEVLTGSTRLKAGTATKLILNILSTLAMVQLGKVASNLMIDLNPSNLKLRQRAIGIVEQLTGMNSLQAQKSLERNGWVIKKVVRNASF